MRKLIMAVTVILMAAALVGADDGKPSFDDADSNHDGNVTYDEYKNIRPDTTPEFFKSLDKDHNDVLDPREFIIIAR